MHKFAGFGIAVRRKIPHLESWTRAASEPLRQRADRQSRALLERTRLHVQLFLRGLRHRAGTVASQLQPAQVDEKILPVIAELDVQKVQAAFALTIEVGHRAAKSQLSNRSNKLVLQNSAHARGPLRVRNG